MSATPPSPLVLDLDRDGLDLVALANSKAYFDLTNDGFRERTAWVGKDDGLLAMDRNGNGTIDNRDELFGAADPANATRVNGFTALAALDTNKDGKIDSKDADFGKLTVWRDLDGDGQTDTGELQTLASLGITSIGLTTKYVNQTQADGTWVSHTSTFTMNGTTSTIADVWFATDPRRAFDAKNAGLAIDPSIRVLPNLKGYGILSDLHVAMQLRADLKTAVQSFVSTAGTLAPAAIPAAVEALVYKWAEVESVVAGSRGPNMDAKHLAVLEKLYGRGWTDWIDRAANPGGNAGPALESLYQSFLASVTAKLLVQVPATVVLQGLIAKTIDLANLPKLPFEGLLGLGYDATTDRVVGDVTARIADAVDRYKADTSASRLSTFVSFLQTVQPFYIANGQTRTAFADTVAAVFSLQGLAAGWQSVGKEIVTGGGVQWGTTSADTLTTASSATIWVGQGGNDTLDGGSGNDFYVYQRGDGNDTITEAMYNGSTDTLIFTDVASTSVTLSRPATNDVLLNVTGTSPGSILLKANLDDYFNRGIDQIQFSDNVVWSRADLRTKLLALASTSGNDTITGFTSDDTISGGRGNDSIDGGDGNDTITEAMGHGTMDRLVFTDVASASVTLSRPAFSPKQKSRFKTKSDHCTLFMR